MIDIHTLKTKDLLNLKAQIEKEIDYRNKGGEKAEQEAPTNLMDRYRNLTDREVEVVKMAMEVILEASVIMQSPRAVLEEWDKVRQ